MHLESDHLAGGVEMVGSRRPSGGGARDAELDEALVGELEGVGEQILDDLLQALVVGEHRLWQVGIEPNLEIESLVLSDLGENAIHLLAQ
ncbi:MAG TPA: hypothetical protein VGN38_13510 [Caulobacteraceae bacterium]|nr:hypothetical protein [Caulobacteraceae bacterium]